MKEFIRLQMNKPFVITQYNFSNIINYKFKYHHDVIPILYSKSFNDKPWKDDWDKIELFDPNGVFLINDNKINKVFGFIISFVKNDFGYLSVLSILPEYRNNGSGSLLVYKAIEYLSNKNIDKIYIDVEKDNFAAKRLYTKIGFQPIL